jgi:hypothetical protein
MGAGDDERWWRLSSWSTERMVNVNNILIAPLDM